MFLPITELENIKDLLNPNILLGFLLIGVINSALMVLISYRFFQSIQQCGYKASAYLKWLKKRDNVYLTRLAMLSLMSLLGFILINMAVSFIDHPVIKYVGFIAYFVFLVVYFNGERKRHSKIPLVITKRMIRLVVTFVILSVIISVLLIFLVNLVAIPLREYLLADFRYGVLCLVPITVPFTVLLAFEITLPFEKAVNKKYIDKCKETLLEKKDLIKIGITGSYAKTSVKNILKQLLSLKYNVLATPESYNTPMGIAKSVKRLTSEHEVFICEMGARRVGDIKELADIVKPDYAVVTGITYQHLESFGTLENVINAKSEIIAESFKGVAFMSSGNKHTKRIYDKAVCEKYLAGLTNDNSLVYAENVVLTETGAEFTLCYGNKKIDVSTPLLGKSNVHNVCLASAVAIKLNIPFEDIASAIARLEPIQHRLSLIKNANGVSVIDDGYNSNPVGVMHAIEVLTAFSGKKYIVTPGMVELGLAESGLNYKMGETLASVCDGVILVGRGSSLHIREGLLSKEYPLEKIYMAKDLEDAKTYVQQTLKEGDVVLFENDLPDILQ